MKRIVQLRTFFLAGTTYLLVSSWVVFGSGALTGCAAAAALIIAIIHTLIAPSDSPEDPIKRLAGLVNKALKGTRFLMVSTSAIWIASLAITIVGAREAYVNSHTVTISGLALTNENAPLYLALVTLNHGQDVIRAQSTKEDGTFSFDKVLLDDSQYSVIAKWHGAVISHPVTAAMVRKGPLSLAFPASASTSPIREFYFDFSDLAIDLLLRGELGPEWARAIGDQPFILENDLFKYTRTLVEPYEETSQFDHFESDAGETKQEEAALRSLANRNRKKSLFFGTNPELLATPDVFDGDVKEVAAGKGNWSFGVFKDYGMPFFWRFANGDDLEMFEDESLT
jgi:hypothetical protein